MTIMASSVKASASSVIDSAMRADFVISSGRRQHGGLGRVQPGPRTLAGRAAQVGADVPGSAPGWCKIYGKVTTVVVAIRPGARRCSTSGVTRGQLARMTSSGIAVSTQAAASEHLSPRQPGRGDLPRPPGPRPTPCRSSTACGRGRRLRPSAGRRRGELPAGPRRRRLRQARPGVSASAGGTRSTRSSPPTRTPPCRTRPSTRRSRHSRSTSCSTSSTGCSRWR